MKKLLLTFFFSLCVVDAAFSQDQSLSKDHPNYHVNTANDHAHKGNYENALEALDKAITANPQNARAFKIRGNIHYDMGNYQLALKDFNKLVDLLPQDSLSYTSRAIVQKMLGNDAAAKKDIEIALSIAPKDEFALKVRKEIYGEKNKKLPFVIKKKGG